MKVRLGVPERKYQQMKTYEIMFNLNGPKLYPVIFYYIICKSCNILKITVIYVKNLPSSNYQVRRIKGCIFYGEIL